VSVGDLKADGFEDIFVTAGMGYPFRYGINSLLLNEAGQNFFDAEFLFGVEPPAGGVVKDLFELDCGGEDKNDVRCGDESGRLVVRGSLSSRSSAIFDLDDDGDLDIITSENCDRPQVLISNLSERRSIHFLKIKLVGTTSNRDALGALVSSSCWRACVHAVQRRQNGLPFTGFNSALLWIGCRHTSGQDRGSMAVRPKGSLHTCDSRQPTSDTH